MGVTRGSYVAGAAGDDIRGEESGLVAIFLFCFSESNQNVALYLRLSVSVSPLELIFPGQNSASTLCKYRILGKFIYGGGFLT